MGFVGIGVRGGTALARASSSPAPTGRVIGKGFIAARMSFVRPGGAETRKKGKGRGEGRELEHARTEKKAQNGKRRERGGFKGKEN